MRSAVGRAARKPRRAQRLALLLGIAVAGCPGPEPSAVPDLTVSPAPIVVDVRWKLGLDGKHVHRSLWVSDGDAPEGAAFRELSLDDRPLPEAQHWLDHVTRYRDHVFSLCDKAFDALQTASGGALPADGYAAKYGRKERLVLPSPALDRIVIRHWRDGGRGIIDLPSLREIPWTSEGNWGKGHRMAGLACWSGDGTRLALVTGGEGYAGPGRIAEQLSHVLVLDSRSGALVHELAVHRGVQGLSFGPDGTRLALLVSDYYLGDSLLERWGASMGHGRPYSNLYVQIVDLATGEVTEETIARDLPEVAENLVWDPAAVTTWGWEPR